MVQKAEEAASTRITLMSMAGYIFVGYLLAVIMTLTKADRVLSAPPEGECTANPTTCPARTFCYRQISPDFFPESLFNLTKEDSDGVATPLYDKDDKDLVLGYVCACYALMGEGGDAPLPGGEEGEFCNEKAPFLSTIAGACWFVLIGSMVTFVRGNKLLSMLLKAEALQFNASGITMILILSATYFQIALVFVYLAELNLWVTDYVLLDGARPTLFGFFAVAQLGGLLEVSIMWADVYAKSAKMGAANDNLAKLKKLVMVLIVMTFIIVAGGMILGLTPAAGAWAGLLIIAVSVAYWTKGRALAKLLSPPDPDAPGSSSAKAAADEIHSTSVQIVISNVFFLLGLGGHFVTVQRPATEAASMICVFMFLLVAVLQQNRLMAYVQFGNRKKLAKVGYAGFRSAIMSSTIGSRVESETSGASTVSTMQSSSD